MPKVSVIVPIYNQEKYLRDCLESIVFQNLEELEILCVNDGSTDASSEVLADFEWQEPRLRIINQENRGVGPARNTGLREARGEYVAFIDPDDWYYDFTVLEKLYSCAQENKALIAGGCFTIQHEEHGERATFRGNEARYVFSESRMYSYGEYQYDYGFHRFIYSRQFLLDNELFFPPLSRFQDPVWFTRAMHAAGSFYGLAEKVYAYRLGHKEIGWNKTKVLDHVAGITAVAELAKDFGYRQLSDLEHRRLVRGSAEIVYPYLLDRDEDMAAALDAYEKAVGARGVARQILRTVIGKRDAQIASGQAALAREEAQAERLKRDNEILAQHIDAAKEGIESVEGLTDQMLSGLGVEAPKSAESASRNLLPYPYVHTTREKDGLTWTDLGDGRLEVTGTAERNTTFTLTKDMKRTSFATEHERYKVSVGAPGGCSLTWYLSGAVGNKDGSGSSLLRDVALEGCTGYESAFEIDTAGFSHFGRLYIVVHSGRTFDHVVFEPMICRAEDWDGTWEPYRDR